MAGRYSLAEDGDYCRSGLTGNPDDTGRQCGFTSEELHATPALEKIPVGDENGAFTSAHRLNSLPHA